MRTALLAFAGFNAGPSTGIAQDTWYRGNTHVHTINSDGNSAPDVVVRWYREHGYHFVVVTDHNMRTNVDILNQLYGVPGRFLVLPGVEVTDRLERRPVHLNGIGVRENVMPQGGTTIADVIDRNAIAITRAGGIAHLNHPNGLLAAAITSAEINATREVSLFEVCCSDYRGGGGVASTEELWDAALTSGKRLFGVAADDAHRFGGDARDAGSSWIMVRAAELSASALLSALQRGDFYSTTGVLLRSLQSDSSRLRIELPTGDGFAYRTYFIGAGGTLLKRDDSLQPTYELTARDQYVRARIERSDGANAWIQPVSRFWSVAGHPRG